MIHVHVHEGNEKSINKHVRVLLYLLVTIIMYLLVPIFTVHVHVQL